MKKKLTLITGLAEERIAALFIIKQNISEGFIINIGPPHLFSAHTQKNTRYKRLSTQTSCSECCMGML